MKIKHNQPPETAISLALIPFQYQFTKTALVTTLKRQAAKILAELHTAKGPVPIIEHGQPPAYPVDPADYGLMQTRMRLLEGLSRGERAITEGKILVKDEAKQAMAKWLK